jgi:hypothetical protein
MLKHAIRALHASRQVAVPQVLVMTGHAQQQIVNDSLSGVWTTHTLLWLVSR